MELLEPLTKAELSKRINNSKNNLEKLEKNISKKEMVIKLNQFSKNVDSLKNGANCYLSNIEHLKSILFHYADAQKSLNIKNKEKELNTKLLNDCQHQIESFSTFKNLEQYYGEILVAKKQLSDTIKLQNYDQALLHLTSLLISTNNVSLQLLSLNYNDSNNSKFVKKIVNELLLSLEDIYQFIENQLWRFYITFDSETLILKPFDKVLNSSLIHKSHPQSILFYSLCTLLKCMESIGCSNKNLTEEGVKNIWGKPQPSEQILLKAEPIKSFVSKFKSDIIGPLCAIYNPGYNGDVNKEEASITSQRTKDSVIQITTDRLKLNIKDQIPPGPFAAKAQALLQNLGSILSFVNDRFDTEQISKRILQAIINVPNSKEANFTQSNQVLVILLLNNISEACLLPFYEANVPFDIELLDDYEVSLKSLKTFEDEMKTQMCVSQNGSDLRISDSLLSSLDSKFATKMTANILSLGRKCLLKGSPYTTLSTNQAKLGMMAPGHSRAASLLNQSRVDSLYTDLRIGDYLPDDSCLFPECQISAFIVEFWDLVRVTIQPLTRENRSRFSTQIWGTLIKLFHLYLTLAPIQSGPEDLGVPLYAAIFLNNCCFVGYLLSVCHTALLSVETEGAAMRTELLDVSLISALQPILNMGFGGFKTQIGTQTSIIREMINGTESMDFEDQIFMYFEPITLLALEHYFNAISNVELDFKQNEKYLKRFSSHLVSLFKVWEPCLPRFATDRTIAILLDRGLDGIIRHVLEMEDISEETCDLFNQQFTNLRQAILEIPSSHENVKNDSLAKVVDHLSTWLKFCGLIQILTLPMLKIAELWTQPSQDFRPEKFPSPRDQIMNGVSQFSATELRHLIRALFQNTQIRMEVLGKIR